MRRFAVPIAIISTLVLLGGLMAGLVSASDPTPPAPTRPAPPPDETVTGTSASDRAALVAFYNATDGPNWWNNANWMSNAPLGGVVKSAVIPARVGIRINLGPNTTLLVRILDSRLRGNDGNMQ